MTDSIPDKSRQPSTQWKFWREARPMELEPYYCYWVSHLTSEALHDKADIATVLAILHQQRDDMQDDALRLHKDKMDLMDKFVFAPPPTAPQGETPRTDSNQFDQSGDIRYSTTTGARLKVVTASFARQLESDLAAERAKVLQAEHDAARDRHIAADEVSARVELQRELADMKDQRDNFEALYAGSGFAVPSARDAPNWEGAFRALLAGCERSNETDEAIENARSFLLANRAQPTEIAPKNDLPDAA